MSRGVSPIGEHSQGVAANRHQRPSRSHRLPSQTTGAALGPISRNEFEVLIGNRISLITFNAVWCAPCRKQDPVIDELIRIYGGKATVVRINVDQNQLMAMELGIQSIPTTILFKGGRELNRYIGFQTLETLDHVMMDALASSF